MSFLEHYITNIAFLPVEFQRSLELIKDLDTKVHELETEAGHLRSKYFSTLKKQGSSGSEDTDTLQRIQEIHEEILNLCDEKQIISQQLKAVLDPCYKKLSSDLLEFKKKLSSDYTSENPHKRRRQEYNTGMPEDYVLYMNDDAYCFCKLQTPGNMIACDNPNCNREWFHFDCVGLSSQPAGDWYCRECEPFMRKSN